MPRKKTDRDREREQSDMGMTQEGGNQSLRSVSGMETDRAERTRGAGSYGDANAGDEGVDDPAMSAVHRDDMTETPRHGDKLGMSESGQRMQSQRSRRTNQRANDERYDDASEFSGRGGQKGERSRREGTGYTEDINNA